MTEPTIAEVLEKYPDCKEFLDAKGRTYHKHDAGIKTVDPKILGGELHILNEYHHMLWIVGLHPKPTPLKVKKTRGFAGFIDPMQVAVDGRIYVQVKQDPGMVPVHFKWEYEEYGATPAKCEQPEPAHIDDAKIYCGLPPPQDGPKYQVFTILAHGHNAWTWFIGRPQLKDGKKYRVEFTEAEND